MNKTIMPFFTTDNQNCYVGTTAYLCFGDSTMNYTRGRMQLPDGATITEAVAVLREFANQLEADAGPMIRHKDELFED